MSFIKSLSHIDGDLLGRLLKDTGSVDPKEILVEFLIRIFTDSLLQLYRSIKVDEIYMRPDIVMKFNAIVILCIQMIRFSRGSHAELVLHR
jgi:hypothetical protein